MSSAELSARPSGQQNHSPQVTPLTALLSLCKCWATTWLGKTLLVIEIIISRAHRNKARRHLGSSHRKLSPVDFISVYDEVALIPIHYKNQVQIGEGSYGTVEKAQHIDTDRFVALKHKKSVYPEASGEDQSARKLEERATFVHEMAVNEYKILA